MKLNKRTFYILIANIITLPLLGNEHLINSLHLNMISTIIYYFLQMALATSLLYDYYKDIRENKFKFSIEFFLFAAFFIILSLSFTFSIVKKVYTISNFIKIILCLYFLILVARIKFNDKQKKIIDYSIIGLLIFTSIFGILQYIFHFDITLAGIEKYPGATGRVKSTFFIATIFDKYLVISILYSIFLLLKDRINVIINLIALILGSIAWAFTFSRTSLIILLIIYAVLFIYCIIKKKYLISLLIITIIILTYFIPGQKYVYSSLAKYMESTAGKVAEKTHIKFISSFSNMILNPFIITFNTENDIDDNDDINLEEIDIQLLENFDYSVNSRKYFSKIGFNIMKSNPLLGIGIGSYNYVFEKQNAGDYIDSTKYEIPDKKYMYPHSMYSQLGAEIGIIGLALFFIIIMYISIKGKNLFSYLILLVVLLSCYSESIFFMKDIAYYTIFIIAFFSNKHFLNKNNN